MTAMLQRSAMSSRSTPPVNLPYLRPSTRSNRPAPQAPRLAIVRAEVGEPCWRAASSRHGVLLTRIYLGGVSKRQLAQCTQQYNKHHNIIVTVTFFLTCPTNRIHSRCCTPQWRHLKSGLCYCFCLCSTDRKANASFHKYIHGNTRQLVGNALLVKGSEHRMKQPSGPLIWRTYRHCSTRPAKLVC